MLHFKILLCYWKSFTSLKKRMAVKAKLWPENSRRTRLQELLKKDKLWKLSSISMNRPRKNSKSSTKCKMSIQMLEIRKKTKENNIYKIFVLNKWENKLIQTLADSLQIQLCLLIEKAVQVNMLIGKQYKKHWLPLEWFLQIPKAKRNDIYFDN